MKLTEINYLDFNELLEFSFIENKKMHCQNQKKLKNYKSNQHNFGHTKIEFLLVCLFQHTEVF